MRVVEDGYLENVSASLSDVKKCERTIEAVYMDPRLLSAIIRQVRETLTEKWNPF